MWALEITRAGSAGSGLISVEIQLQQFSTTLFFLPWDVPLPCASHHLYSFQLGFLPRLRDEVHAEVHPRKCHMFILIFMKVWKESVKWVGVGRGSLKIYSYLIVLRYFYTWKWVAKPIIESTPSRTYSSPSSLAPTETTSSFETPSTFEIVTMAGHAKVLTFLWAAERAWKLGTTGACADGKSARQATSIKKRRASLWYSC